MSSEWTSIRLGDHCTKIGSGSTPTGGKDAYLDFGPYTLIRSQNIYNDGFTPSGLAFIGDAQAKKLDGVSVEKDDVLLNITGDSVARVCLAPVKYLPARVNQHVAIIRPKTLSLDNRYLRYFLRSPQQQEFMLGMASAGATRPALTKVMIENFKIPCPPLEIQQQIADILGSLDDRISLLRETNATLEAIAQALFKSWFVDFDPVHAKQQGREPEGMDEATAALFPDSFEESELGLVPKGWKANILDGVSTVGIGKTPPRKEQHWFSQNPKDVRWVSIRDMGMCGAYISTTNEFLTAESIEKFNVRVVPNNTVILSFKMTIGRVSICDGEMTTNEAIAHFNLNDESPVSSEFIYLYLKQFNYSTLSSTSSIADAVNSKSVKNIPILIPNKTVHTAFQEQILLIFNKIKVIEQQIQTVSTIRDTLLPRLISGQLLLPEAETMLEEACA